MAGDLVVWESRRPVVLCESEDRRTGRFWVELDHPHRILRWVLAPDLDAQLTGTRRLDYWRRHDNGDGAGRHAGHGTTGAADHAAGRGRGGGVRCHNVTLARSLRSRRLT